MLQVVGVLPNTPAAMVGIKKGDKIVAIDEVPLTNMTLKQAVSKLRGAPGTRLTLEILRQEKAPFQVSLVRAVPTTSTKTSSTGAAPAKTTKTSTTPSKEPTGSETTEQMF